MTSPRQRRDKRERNRLKNGKHLMSGRQVRGFLRRSKLKENPNKSQKSRISPHYWIRLADWCGEPYRSAYNRLYEAKGGTPGSFDIDIYVDTVMALVHSRAERATKHRWMHYVVTQRGKLRYHPTARVRKQR
jgi:hypothetical protein